MATFWFNKGREGFADGSFSWTGSEIRFALIDNTLYNPSATVSDKFLSTPAAISGAIVARTAAAASGKTATDGILDCDDPTFASVASGHTVGAWIAYYNAGTDASNRMICFVDNSGGLPFTSNGGDVTIQLDNTNKLGKI
jgi:hypothetical protein